MKHLLLLFLLFSNLLYADIDRCYLASPVEPASTGAVVAFLTLICPPAATVVEAIVCGVAVATGGYCAYKKHQQKKVTFAQIQEEVVACNGGGGLGPNNNWDDEEEKRKHPHGIYKDAPYHHKNSGGSKSPCPKDGQKALDNSVPVQGNIRTGISEGEIVVLYKTEEMVYHGYSITWESLLAAGESTQLIRNTLQRCGLVNSVGKIIRETIFKAI